MNSLLVILIVTPLLGADSRSISATEHMSGQYHSTGCSRCANAQRPFRTMSTDIGRAQQESNAVHTGWSRGESVTAQSSRRTQNAALSTAQQSASLTGNNWPAMTDGQQHVGFAHNIGSSRAQQSAGSTTATQQHYHSQRESTRSTMQDAQQATSFTQNNRFSTTGGRKGISPAQGEVAEESATSARYGGSTMEREHYSSNQGEHFRSGVQATREDTSLRQNNELSTTGGLQDGSFTQDDLSSTTGGQQSTGRVENTRYTAQQSPNSLRHAESNMRREHHSSDQRQNFISTRQATRQDANLIQNNELSTTGGRQGARFTQGDLSSIAGQQQHTGLDEHTRYTAQQSPNSLRHAESNMRREHHSSDQRQNFISTRQATRQDANLIQNNELSTTGGRQGARFTQGDLSSIAGQQQHTGLDEHTRYTAQQSPNSLRHAESNMRREHHSSDQRQNFISTRQATRQDANLIQNNELSTTGGRQGARFTQGDLSSIAGQQQHTGLDEHTRYTAQQNANSLRNAESNMRTEQYSSDQRQHFMSATQAARQAASFTENKGSSTTDQRQRVDVAQSGGTSIAHQGTRLEENGGSATITNGQVSSKTAKVREAIQIARQVAGLTQNILSMTKGGGHVGTATQISQSSTARQTPVVYRIVRHDGRTAGRHSCSRCTPCSRCQNYHSGSRRGTYMTYPHG
ncbi:uncharacterized protein LOC135383294 [Ornithodoros turicata]|uniref:uncharacterized protein LOC135383294 n=1 Tax=Ornithodoros turicata TaxID=34597 RepID=UPI00313A3B54